MASESLVEYNLNMKEVKALYKNFLFTVDTTDRVQL